MLLVSQAVVIGLANVVGSDFYDIRHAAVFAAIGRLHAQGIPIDVTTVGDELRRTGELSSVGGLATLVEIVTATPATSSAGRYARIVVEHATMRALVATGGRITEIGYSRPTDISDAVGEARSLLAKVEAALPTSEVVVQSLDDLHATVDEPEDWVIPGVLARGERLVLVAHPGHGKSTLWRQMAVMCGQGIHPFRYSPVPPIRTLLIDLENPETIIRRKCAPIVDQAMRSARPYTVDQAMLFHHPAPLDIRSRAGFAALDTACAQAQPDLVCLGPLYKLFRSGKGEKYEDVAVDVTGRLDDLRTRHGFALMIEHHAPKGSNGVREMVPGGSWVWEAWPEFGFGLVPVKKGDRTILAWGDWRGARDERDWPTRLERGRVWPWESVFDTVYEEAF
jgi:replicative DNA helicase